MLWLYFITCDDPCLDNIFGLLKLEIRPEYNTVADLTELRLNQSEQSSCEGGAMSPEPQTVGAVWDSAYPTGTTTATKLHRHCDFQFPGCQV